MMKEAVAGIESTGQKVFTFAPSAEASRGVLRSEAGFANAETVEALLQNSKLQEQVRGQVIWIDEAGLLGARALARVAGLAEKKNCRVVLSGDTAQHRAVERGDGNARYDMQSLVGNVANEVNATGRNAGYMVNAKIVIGKQINETVRPDFEQRRCEFYPSRSLAAFVTAKNVAPFLVRVFPNEKTVLSFFLVIADDTVVLEYVLGSVKCIRRSEAPGGNQHHGNRQQAKLHRLHVNYGLIAI